MNTQRSARVIFRILLSVLGLSVAAGAMAQSGYDPLYGGQPQTGYGYDQPGYDTGYDQYGDYTVDRPVDSFYDELSPYGQWVNTPEYGRVWMPRVEQGFQPYATNGHWVMTEYGNTWVSDYAWGWAPFHYGRWYFDAYRGWVWVPGREWAPAWVAWRSGGGYYGWAPLAPGINISLNVNIPYNYWVFVPLMYINSSQVYSYCLPRNNYGGFFNNTVIINNYHRYNNRTYYYGPNRRDIEYVTRRNLPVYRSNEVYRSGGYSRNNNSWYERRGGGSYSANNGWRNGPDRGQSNRTGSYPGPSRDMNDGTRNYPGNGNNGRYQSPNAPANGGYDNNRGRYQAPNAPSNGGYDNNRDRGQSPGAPAGGGFDNNRDRSQRPDYQPQNNAPATMPERRGESGWGRNDNGGFRGRPSDAGSTNAGGYGGDAPRGGQPSRRYEVPGQPTMPQTGGGVQGGGRQESGGGQYQQRGGGQEQRSAPMPDLGGGQGGNGRRGPR